MTPLTAVSLLAVADQLLSLWLPFAAWGKEASGLLQVRAQTGLTGHSGDRAAVEPLHTTETGDSYSETVTQRSSKTLIQRASKNKKKIKLYKNNYTENVCVTLALLSLKL